MYLSIPLLYFSVSLLLFTSLSFCFSPPHKNKDDLCLSVYLSVRVGLGVMCKLLYLGCFARSNIWKILILSFSFSLFYSFSLFPSDSLSLSSFITGYLSHNLLVVTSLTQLIKASDYACTGRYPVQARVMFLNKFSILVPLKIYPVAKFCNYFIGHRFLVNFKWKTN